MMHITRNPYTQMLQVQFHPQVRREQYHLLKDPFERTVGRVDPPNIAKDLLDRPLATYRPVLFPCYHNDDDYR